MKWLRQWIAQQWKKHKTGKASSRQTDSAQYPESFGWNELDRQNALSFWTRNNSIK